MATARMVTQDTAMVTDTDTDHHMPTHHTAATAMDLGKFRSPRTKPNQTIHSNSIESSHTNENFIFSFKAATTRATHTPTTSKLTEPANSDLLSSIGQRPDGINNSDIVQDRSHLIYSIHWDPMSRYWRSLVETNR